MQVINNAPFPPKAYLSFSFTPLRHIAFRQFGFLDNPGQPLFLFLCQLGIAQFRLLAEYHQQLFRPAALEACHFLQIPLEFVHNGILRGAVASAPVGFPYVLHDSINIVMYPAAEIVTLPHMDGLQDTGGLVMLPGLVLLHNFSPRHVYPCVQVLYLRGGRYPPHKSVYRPAASQNPGATPVRKAARC